MRGGFRRDEDGSQVVSHTLVQSLVVFIVLGLMQLAFALHVRNIAIDAASEGARYASLSGASLIEGEARTRALLNAGLHADRIDVIEAHTEIQSGAPLIVMTVSTHLPVLGPFGPARTLTVRAHAWKEPT
ncbi:MAG: TadE/TadG family type IV pilus assembly protein [Actinomycetaceae bacterium]|nr:TadE/TadG family type IV pilus assembly protein [Actinomycetaceae bacterium]